MKSQTGEIPCKEWFWVTSLAVLCFVLYLLRLGSTDLGTGEALYAAVAKEIVSGGHWIVLHMRGEVYCDKPPLYFWLTALFSTPVGSVTELTARLPAALLASGTVLVVYFLGKRLFGQRAGLVAALILATSPEFEKYARQGRLDIPFTFFTTASLASFYYGYSSTSDKRRYYLLFWALWALALLTKTLLGILFVGGTVILYLFWNKDLKAIREMELIRGCLVFAGILCLWPALILLQGDVEYVKTYIFKNSGLWFIANPMHTKPFYYYIPEFLVGTAPWSLCIIPFLYLYFTGSLQTIRKELLFVIFWFLVIFIPYQGPERKRAFYLLVLYPAFALMMASFWNRYMEGTEERCGSREGLFVALSVAMGIIVANTRYSSAPTVAVYAGGLIFLAVVLYLIRYRKPRLLFAVAFTVLFTSEITYSQYYLPKEQEGKSEKLFCQKIAAVMEPNSEWVIYGDPSKWIHPFYPKTFPNKFFDDKEGFLKYLDSFPGKKLYCLLLETDYLELKDRYTLVPVLEYPGLGTRSGKLVFSYLQGPK